MESMKCPLTKQIMVDPVVALDGYSYERRAIEEYFKTSNKSPMTNELMSTVLVPNHSLRQSIQEYLKTVSESPKSSTIIPTTLVSAFRPFKETETGFFAYEVIEEVQIYKSLQLVYPTSKLAKDTVVVAIERLESETKPPEPIIRLSNNAYIKERYLKKLEIERGLFVYKAVKEVNPRKIPSTSKKFSLERSVQVGRLVSSTLRIKQNRTFYFLAESKGSGIGDKSGENQWFYDFKNDQMVMQSVGVEFGDWILLNITKEELKSRIWPDYEVEEGDFILKPNQLFKSTVRVQGYAGIWYYRTKIDGKELWFNGSKLGKPALKILLKEPKPITQNPGELLKMCIGYDSWCLILESIGPNGEKTQEMEWDNIPEPLADHLKRALIDKRLVNEFCFGWDNDEWYLSISRPDGSEPKLFGTLDDLEYNSKVAVGEFSNKSVIVYQDGEYRGMTLPPKLEQRLEKVVRVHNIVLGPSNTFFIRDNLGTAFSNPDQLLKEQLRDGKALTIGIFGDNNWIIIKKELFICSNGVSEEIKEILEDHYITHQNIVKEQEEIIKNYRQLVENDYNFSESEE